MALVKKLLNINLSIARGLWQDCVVICREFHSIFCRVVVRQVDTSFVGIIRQSHFVGSGNLAVIAECFTCNILAERSIITFTQGKFKRRTICAFRPKMEFLCYASDKYYMNDVTKSQRADCAGFKY